VSSTLKLKICAKGKIWKSLGWGALAGFCSSDFLAKQAWLCVREGSQTAAEGYLVLRLGFPGQVMHRSEGDHVHRLAPGGALLFVLAESRP
jgi:hypothetical protein